MPFTTTGRSAMTTFILWQDLSWSFENQHVETRTYSSTHCKGITVELMIRLCSWANFIFLQPASGAVTRRSWTMSRSQRTWLKISLFWQLLMDGNPSQLSVNTFRKHQCLLMQIDLRLYQWSIYLFSFKSLSMNIYLLQFHYWYFQIRLNRSWNEEHKGNYGIWDLISTMKKW